MSNPTAFQMWRKPETKPTGLMDGDRLVIVVMCRRHRLQKKLEPMLAIIEATENGWKNEDGYDFSDAVSWCWELDLIQSAQP